MHSSLTASTTTSSPSFEGECAQGDLRTSVEQFRETKLSMKSNRRSTRSDKILEGGVQRAGDRVRINVQLIDAATDAHLWAEQYDRELTAANIFAIQSEVASCNRRQR